MAITAWPLVGGADSISIAGNASGSYIYGNVGDDRVSLAAGLIAGSIYGGAVLTASCQGWCIHFCADRWRCG